MNPEQMSPEQRLAEALKCLAAADRAEQAGPAVEARLLAAYRQQHQSSRRFWIPMALAAGLALAAFLWTSYQRPIHSNPDPAPLARQSPAPLPVLATPEQPAAPTASKPRPRRRVAPTIPHEIATDFFPLLESAAPFESGELRRVMVPASTMLRVGLPVREDRISDQIQADVLIGQDGLARAIRFVTFEQR